MILRLRSILLFVIIYAPILAQEKKVRFVPEFPNQNQTVKIFYIPDKVIFNSDSKILCRIFFTGENEFSEAIRMDFPLALDVSFTNESNILIGTFNVPNKATAIMIVMLNSLGKIIDNNNGSGYWIPIYNNDIPLPGAFSGIADLYASAAAKDIYYLKQNKEMAKVLYEKDFEQNPSVKRRNSIGYLSTFDISSETQRTQFKNVLDLSAHYTDLGEWELKAISRYYNIVNDTALAAKYDKLIFERYPQGSWALQTNSLMPAMQIGREKDLKKQKKKFEQFKEKYCKSYPDEWTRIVMESRKGKILKEMLLSLIENDEQDYWLTEVNSLDPRFKFSAYDRSVNYLIEHEKLNNIAGKDQRKSDAEKSLMVYKVSSNESLLAFAEKLSREAIAWWRQNLDMPRRLTDRPFHTDKEIHGFREEELGRYLDHLGQVLLLENKFDEATGILREAITLHKRSDPDINEHYVESLIKTNQVSEAIKESETVIRLGKSTAKIDDFHMVTVNDPSAKEEAMANIKEELTKQLISEIAPDGRMVDANGKSIFLKDYKNKTIILDFWAMWCPPCIANLKSMAEVVDKYRNDANIVFLFLNTERISDVTKKRVENFLKEKEYGFNVLYDPGFKTTTSFKLESLPTKVVIDRQGNIRFRKVGIKWGLQEQTNELIAMIELVK